MTVSAASFCRSCWTAILPARCTAAKMSFIMAGPACAISARSSTSSLAKAISAISRWFCCCRSLRLDLFRRFLPEHWALALALVFIAVPVGAIFGTSFFNYVKWAARGFADPAAYILFIAGICADHRRAAPTVPAARFSPALFGALLLALGIFMKPIVAPAAAVLLGGAGLVRALSPAMAAPRRALPRLFAGVLDGPAQLGLRPCLRAVQRQFRATRLCW